MIQYASHNDDHFMPLATGVDNQTVPGVDPERGIVADRPATAGFAVLLQRGYLTGYRIFICDGSALQTSAPIGTRPGEMPVDPARATLAEYILSPEHCSYGYDITKHHWASPECAILADKPSDYVVDHYAALDPEHMGASKHNSDNHGGQGQNVIYNDGHVHWSFTSEPEVGDDEDI
jgi:hypothetical protein